jgi:hypothetical protein
MKDLTIVTVDSLNHEATAFAIDKTLAVFPDAQVLQIGDKRCHKAGRFVEVPKFDAKEHSRICLNDVPDLVETPYALFIQYDGFPTQPQYWINDFLHFDYIGAPWQSKEPGWEVGNGGFSFRSKKLLELTKQIKQNKLGPDLEWLEDQLICVTHRRWLEGWGIKFAPKSVADQFSHEHPTGYAPSFGFHGTFQAPYYLSEEEFKVWINLIQDQSFLGKGGLFLTPYGLWKQEMWGALRALMIRGNKIRSDWNQKVWEECRWIIPNYVDKTVDLKEMYDMIQRMGAPEDI